MRELGYSIKIEPGIIDQAGSLIRQVYSGYRALIIADSNVAELYGDRLVRSVKSAGIHTTLVHFPAGETSKTLEQSQLYWEICSNIGIDRDSLIIGFGGGVTGDLAGFVAACWMRGIAFIQIPTTLLSMVDSSIGGKVGVNTSFGKNLIGAFKKPLSIIIDPTLLSTMEPRAYRSGLAEVLKYGMLHYDFFLWQESNCKLLVKGDPEAVAHAIKQSCKIKSYYVEVDEFETGIRAHLNYGHTFGHALEKDTEYKKYYHGEAVAIGMRMAATLSQSLGILEDDYRDCIARQDNLLSMYQLLMTHQSINHPNVDSIRLTNHCFKDKKVSNWKINFILPVDIGTVGIYGIGDTTLIASAFIKHLKK